MSDEDELRRYLEAAANEQSLSRTEERMLATARDNSDGGARQRLIRANMKLVVSIARRYEGRPLPLDVLLRAGHAGLERAVDRFDPPRGYRLSTYATWWIRQAITRAIAEGKEPT